MEAKRILFSIGFLTDNPENPMNSWRLIYLAKMLK